MQTFFAGNRWLGWGKPPTPGSTSIGEKPAKTHRTFRVRGVPQEWDFCRLQDFLKEDNSVATVKSLAPEIHGSSSTGTITYQDALTNLRTVLTEPWTRCLPKSLETQSTRPEYLTLDADFLGMTTLFMPPDEDHRVE